MIVLVGIRALLIRTNPAAVVVVVARHQRISLPKNRKLIRARLSFLLQ